MLHEKRISGSDITDLAREETDMVERAGERMNALARYGAKTGLEADHAIIGGGTNDRAERL